MTKGMTKRWIAILASMLIAGSALAEESVRNIVVQPLGLESTSGGGLSTYVLWQEAPLFINGLRLEYEAAIGHTGPGMLFYVDYTNRVEQPITALHIGFVMLDRNNQELASKTGLLMRFLGDLMPGQTDDMRWKFSYDRDFETATAIAYVRSVQLGDGSTWRVSQRDIERQLQAFIVSKELAESNH